MTKMLPNILCSRLTPPVDEIIRDHQCGCNRSTTNQFFCVCQILEKKWDYNGIVQQVFMDFRKACDSVRSKELCNILIEFGIAIKLVRSIKMCLNETYSDICFLFRMIWIQRDAYWLLLLNFALWYVIGKVGENVAGLKLNGTFHLPVCVDDGNILVHNIHVINKNPEALNVGQS
jgi:hypothetical protein